MKTKQGCFITFEGIDGAGKTTQLTRLARRLDTAGARVVQTREPGGTFLGDKIRAMLLDSENHMMTARTEALLYAASRAQHVEEVIQPALAAGHIVLCDRFVDASIAYQGGGLQLGAQAVAAVNQFALSGCSPDLTILFHLPIATARTRLAASRGQAALDRIELRDDAYFLRVQEAFMALAARDPQRFRIVDAGLEPDVLEQEIHEIVWKYITQE
ncbi:dTMP kinase [Alicyclobacillus fodiniaquatilis]|jgi:dTMP kinase|uniref:Thymidylate kinase n=1 Tax=Alicyclobacillus fodiniaquatilis TaxID=1661150 RepID=A0ABW4JD83_9BACL